MGEDSTQLSVSFEAGLVYPADEAALSRSVLCLERSHGAWSGPSCEKLSRLLSFELIFRR